jgi:ribosomal protein L37AE/L43A
LADRLSSARDNRAGLAECLEFDFPCMNNGIDFGARALNPTTEPGPRIAERGRCFVAEMEHRCPQCAGPQLSRVRDGAFALEWRCDRCGHEFMNPLLSVVFIDGNERRREELVSCLKEEGIPVVAVRSIAELEEWPVGKVLVTPAPSVTSLWFDVGALHVFVLADSDEERAVAADITHDRATVADGKPESLLASLRKVAKTLAAVPDGNGTPNRRSGPRERRRHPRRDRRY